MSNGKLNSQYNFCTNIDTDISKVHVIADNNCTRYTQTSTNLTTVNNISDESSVTVATLS